MTQLRVSADNGLPELLSRLARNWGVRGAAGRIGGLRDPHCDAETRSMSAEILHRTRAQDVKATWKSLRQRVELTPERNGSDMDLCGAEVLLQTLEKCFDDESCINLLMVLADLLRGGSVRRVSALVDLGASQCLLSLLARVSPASPRASPAPPRVSPVSASSHRDRLLSLLLTSLASLGIRDKKFPGRARASGALTTTLTIARLSLTNPTLTDPTLTDPALVNDSIASQPLTSHSASNHAIPGQILTNPTLTLTNHALANHSLTNHPIGSDSVTNHSVTNSTLTNDSLTNPTLANHSLTNPTLTNNSLPDHSLTNHCLGSPSPTSSSLTSPSLTSPTLANPARADPALTDRTLTNPTLTAASYASPSLLLGALQLMRVLVINGTNAGLLGKAGAMDLVLKITANSTTQRATGITKAALDTLVGLLKAKVNARRAAERGHARTLLRVYLAWHGRDVAHQRHPWVIRELLLALGRLARTGSGRRALGAAGTTRALYLTTLAILAQRPPSSSWSTLADLACTVMRRVQPRLRLPLPSIRCPLSYTLPPPGGSTRGSLRPPPAHAKRDAVYVDSSDSDSDQEEQTDIPETDAEPGGAPPKNHGYEDLSVYARFCPELTHDFEEYMVDGADDADAADDDAAADDDIVGEVMGSESSPPQLPTPALPPPWWRGGESGERAGERDGERAAEAACRYARLARSTHAPGLPLGASGFPDSHGHCPDPRTAPQLARAPHVQRDYVLEDIARNVYPETLINKVVFDIEAPSLPSAEECGDAASPHLTFYSSFESGNLRKAIQVRSFEYDLVLNSDINTERHHQWFYFEIGGAMEAGSKYRINIVNCEKTTSQFNHGMQPVLYSVREALEGRPYWVRTGTNICYYKNSYRRPKRLTGGVGGRTYFSLSLTLTFPHSGDVCYLAHHYPYTYTSLMVDLEDMVSACDRRSVFVQRDMLCLTVGGNACPVLTITSPPSSQRELQSLRRRPCVVLSARVHPGESNCSWVLRGALAFLLGSHPEARALRRAYIVRVIPMLNPDGVASGAHRCSLAGEDLNRQWKNPSPHTSPTVYHSKGLLLYLASVGHTPVVFCDCHGHSGKKNVFLYGCSVRETLWHAEQTAACGLSEDTAHRTLSRLLASCAPAFCAAASRFVVERAREATARVVVWREVGVRRSYTMETTYCGCDHGPYKGLQLGLRELQEMGQRLCVALLRLRPRLGHGEDVWTPQDKALRDEVGVEEEVEEEEDDPPCDEEPDYSADSDSAPDDFLEDLLLSDSEIDAEFDPEIDPEVDPEIDPEVDPAGVATLAIRPGVVTYDTVTAE